MRQKQALSSDIEKTYTKNLSHTRSQLNYCEKILSRFIHITPIEIVLDFLSKYILNPPSMITGGVFGVLAIAVYIVASLYGYTLAGSEVISLFIAGWIIGLVVCYIKAGFFGSGR